MLRVSDNGAQILDGSQQRVDLESDLDVRGQGRSGNGSQGGSKCGQSSQLRLVGRHQFGIGARGELTGCVDGGGALGQQVLQIAGLLVQVVAVRLRIAPDQGQQLLLAVIELVRNRRKCGLN